MSIWEGILCIAVFGIFVFMIRFDEKERKEMEARGFKYVLVDPGVWGTARIYRWERIENKTKKEVNQ